MKNIRNRNDGSVERELIHLKQIQKGLYYICIVCNRCLQRKWISRLRFDSYKDLSFCVDSLYSEFYICWTSDRKLKKNLIPYQAVANKFALGSLPSETSSTETLKDLSLEK